jgi:hypothetical protein
MTKVKEDTSPTQRELLLYSIGDLL